MSNDAFVEPDFKALFEGGPGLYMVLDPNMRVVAASDAYLKATLTRREDIIGRHVFEVFPDNPDDSTADAVRNSRASFNRVLQTQATDVMGLQRHDVRRPESEGSGFEVRYWSAVNSPVLNPDGSIAYILHRVENVTEFVLQKQQGIGERKRSEVALQEAKEELEVTAEELRLQNEELMCAQSALQESEARLRRLYESGLIGVIYWNMDGVITDANDKFLEMVGYTRKDLVAGRIDWVNMTPPEYRHLDGDSAIELKATGVNKKPFEKEYIRKDGTRVPIIVAGAMLDEARFNGVAFVLDITERKRAEKKLQTTLERFYTVLSSMYGSILLVSDEGRIEYANQAFCDFFFLDDSPDDLIGHTSAQMIEKIKNVYLHPDEEVARIQEIVSQGRPIRGEEISLQGEQTCLRDFIPIYIDGKSYGRLWHHLDISERKRAEEALERLGQQRQLALDAAHMGWWHYDPITRIASWDDRYKEIFGVAGYQRPNDEILARLHPEDLPRVWAKVEEALDPVNPQPYSAEYRINLPDGSMKWIEAHGIASFEGAGENRRATSLVGTVADITERKQAEEQRQRLARELADRVSELQAVLDAAPVAVWIAHDPQCQRITGNAYADQILQAPSGGNVSRSASPEDAAVTYKVFRKGVEVKPAEMPAQVAAATGKPVMGDELELLFPDGRTVYLIESAMPLFDAEGHVRGAVIAGADVTQIKLAEESLRMAKDKLEQRVLERTAELSEAKEDLEVINEELRVELEQHQKLEVELIKAKDNAEAATKAKAEFLANMSHEIRTPMNAVIGMTGLLLEEPLTPEQRDNLGLIRINGDALLTIINDILDFSKMESDKVVLEEYQFNLRQCVEEALDLVAIKAAEKGINLAYTIDKNVPDTIIGDFGRLRQILGNLLSNAVKFTDVGEVTLSVSSQKLDEANEVHFAVEDTGIGIPQDHMDQLFKPFSQVESSTTRLYGGTGLGLAISKKLVEMMGGKIWAESLEGMGSTFHFTIKASSGQFGPQLAVVSPQIVGKHALIIEDNKTNRRILGKQVYDWGMIPMAATSAQEALKYIRRGDDFDIAILDMDLQDMSGLELEEEIRKYNRTLPLVLLTSLGKHIPPNHAYLTKPIKPSQLHKVLTDIMSRQPARRAAQSATISRSGQSNPLRILLAEDNVSSQKVALQMLKKLGYKADTVANGIEALHALERQHYDVVLMDVKMPEMNGLEATRIIRQRWPDNGPKIIAITAYALQGDREKFIEAGMDDYIAKPVKIDELAATLKKYS